MPPLTPRALRTRWALAALRREAARRRVGATTGTSARRRGRGLDFPGPVGLAGGFDRHGALAGEAARLGLAAVEAGTFFRAAPVFRLAGPKNRQAGGGAARGVSIGKRPAASWAEAGAELARAYAAFGRGADYVTLNPGRQRPPVDVFARVIAAVARSRDARRARCGAAPALVVKLPAAWTAGADRLAVAAAFVAAGADGLLVSAEGAPRRQARAVLAELARGLGEGVCLISVGGVDGAAEAAARLAAGARLVQVHRAVATGGAPFLDRVARALARFTPTSRAKPRGDRARR